MYRVIRTTDREHLGQIIDTLPNVGDHFKFDEDDYAFIIIAVECFPDRVEIISYNYIMVLVKI